MRDWADCLPFQGHFVTNAITGSLARVAHVFNLIYCTCWLLAKCTDLVPDYINALEFDQVAEVIGKLKEVCGSVNLTVNLID